MTCSVDEELVAHVEFVETRSEVKMGEKQDLKTRSKRWFVEIVGLPNWGINLVRDLFHAKDGDLFEVFQKKVSHKGYQLSEYKSMRVKERMEEL